VTACARPELTLNSGIFGYINYLVEKDRKYILDTLVNGESEPDNARCPPSLQWQHKAGLPVAPTVADRCPLQALHV
jgi:hypothetical protein